MRHPRHPEMVYPLDYGYLQGTTTGDGSLIDVWLGSRGDTAVMAIACTVDLLKRDAELKLLLGCTEDEMRLVNDDVLIAGESKADLQLLYRDIVEYLRGFGLQPNEAKSRVVESSIARRDHTAIDDLFSAAKAELVEELEGQHIVYGLGLAWHVDKAKRLQVELSATKALLAAVDTHPQFRQRILRFALRPLAAVGDRTVKPLVLGLLADEPVLTRDFARYLVQFPNDADVLEALAQVISEAERHDPYVVMHAIAVLSEADRLPRPALNSLMNLYRRPGHDSCRALAAIALAKLGDGNHRQDLIASYANERSDYVRAALVFSAQYFVPPEKATAKSIWSDSSALNAEIASIVL